MAKQTIMLSALLLMACGHEAPNYAAKDKSDPAVAVAMTRPLMTDARLDRDSNRFALRPPEGAVQAIVPPGSMAARAGTLRDRARKLTAAAGSAFAGCSWDVAYSYGWAARMPRGLELPEDGQTIEGAGRDTASCQLRLVALSTAVVADDAVAAYRKRAERDGFAVKDLSVSGASGMLARRPRDGAALIVTTETRESGAVIEIISNRGE